MRQMSKVLCPIDFSDFSRHALDHAVAMARPYGARVTALHVVAPMMSLQPSIGAPLYSPQVYMPEDLERVRLDAERFVAGEAGQDPIETKVAEGNIAGEIVSMARALPADLLVMGTHGRSGFDRLMLGSVTERVLRKAPCPVLTVPRRAPDAVPAGPLLFTHILCAVDYSPSSAHALEHAWALARAMAAQLSVLHVFEQLPTYEPVFIGGSGAAEFEQDLRNRDRARLHEFVSAHTGGSAEVTEVSAEGKPWREIVRVAADLRCDLIVIGVHGGAAGLLAFGSTTNHVVRESVCPVLSLKA